MFQYTQESIGSTKASSLASFEPIMMKISRPIYSECIFKEEFEHTKGDKPRSRLNFLNKSAEMLKTCAQNNYKLIRGLRTSPLNWLGNSIFIIFPITGLITRILSSVIAKFQKSKILKKSADTYDLKKDFLLDTISGITTGVVRTPQSMAYALLVRIGPEHGLYSALYSALIYSLIAPTPHCAAGVQGVISLMLGDSAFDIVQRELSNYTNETMPISRKEFESQRMVSIVLMLTFVTGIVQILLGLVRMGFVTNYLSQPLTSGLLCASAYLVLISQLPKLLGLEAFVTDYSGNFKSFFKLQNTIRTIMLLNPFTLLISFLTLFSLLILKKLSENFKVKFGYPIPCELIILLFVVPISFLIDFNKKYNIKVVGHLPAGLRKPELMDFRSLDKVEIFEILSASMPLVVVSFALAYAMMTPIAQKHAYEINSNRELINFGATNAIGALFGSFVITASMSGTVLNFTLGAKSQISNLIAAIVVLVTLGFLGPLFQPVPESVLSCIVLVNFKPIFANITSLIDYWRSNQKFDFFIWLATFIATLCLDVGQGLLTGVILSLATVLLRTHAPDSYNMGRIGTTEIYERLDKEYSNLVHSIPGLAIFRCEGSLYFGSAENIRKDLYQNCGCNPIEIYKKIRLKRREKLKSIKNMDEVERNCELKPLLEESDETNSADSDDWRLFDLENSSYFIRSPSRVSFVPETASRKSKTSSPPRRIKYLILDLSMCSFIDFSGVKCLVEIILDFQQINVSVFLAEVRETVMKVLTNYAKVITNKTNFRTQSISSTTRSLKLAKLNFKNRKLLFETCFNEGRHLIEESVRPLIKLNNIYLSIHDAVLACQKLSKRRVNQSNQRKSFEKLKPKRSLLLKSKSELGSSKYQNI